MQGSANYPIDTSRSNTDTGFLVWNVGTLKEGVIPGEITFDAVIDSVVADGTRPRPIGNNTVNDSIEGNLTRDHTLF